MAGAEVCTNLLLYKPVSEFLAVQKMWAKCYWKKPHTFAYQIIPYI